MEATQTVVCISFMSQTSAHGVKYFMQWFQRHLCLLFPIHKQTICCLFYIVSRSYQYSSIHSSNSRNLHLCWNISFPLQAGHAVKYIRSRHPALAPLALWRWRLICDHFHSLTWRLLLKRLLVRTRKTQRRGTRKTCAPEKPASTWFTSPRISSLQPHSHRV